MKYIILATVIIMALSGCLTAPKCGSSRDSETVFSDTKTCEVRIRQVLVVSKMSLPKSVKSSDLTTWDLDWVGSDLADGQIEFGHFILKPPQPMEKTQ